MDRPAPADPATQAHPDGANAATTILVVDDDPINRLLLDTQLRKDGYCVLDADSGEAALRMLGDGVRPDLILLDIMMPGVDGFMVAESIKSRAETRNIPIIMVTALADQQSRMKALDKGAEEYLSKPINLQELSVRVRNILRLKRYQDTLEARGNELKDEVIDFASKLNNAKALLNEAQQQLLQSEKMAALGQLAAGIAHEINSPIGYVNSNLGSLKRDLNELTGLLNAYLAIEDGAADKSDFSGVRELRQQIELDTLIEDTTAMVDESIDGISRVKMIIDDLRHLAHSDTNQEWQLGDLHQGLDATLRLVRNEIKYKAEVVRAYGDIPPIECHPSQLNQVFLNLIVNAAQAFDGHRPGTITVATGRSDDAVWVEIRDTGCGIAPENLGHIFEPFFTTKPIGQGTGLGLSLSSRIVQQHAGHIAVSSRINEGTAFRVTLPIRQTQRATAAPPSE